MSMNLKISLTNKAVQVTKDKLLKENKDLLTTVFRIGVHGGKCAGYSYVMQFEDKNKVRPTKDEVFSFDELTVVVDKKSLIYLNGSVLDYETKSLMWQGYKFNNPNVEKNCSCGESFSMKT